MRPGRTSGLGIKASPCAKKNARFPKGSGCSFLYVERYSGDTFRGGSAAAIRLEVIVKLQPDVVYRRLVTELAVIAELCAEGLAPGFQGSGERDACLVL